MQKVFSSYLKFTYPRSKSTLALLQKMYSTKENEKEKKKETEKEKKKEPEKEKKKEAEQAKKKETEPEKKKESEPEKKKEVEQEKPKEKPKIAVILSGCGMLDGSEIHESAATVIHISKCNFQPVFYAPDCPQEVMDHLKSTSMPGERNALVEAARIARGEIFALSELKCEDANALVFVGGFGVAKTLSSFAKDGAACTVNTDIVRIANDFVCAKKPMGFMCISPVLAARMFPCVKITLGQKGDPNKWPYADAIEKVAEMGAQIECLDVDGVAFDEEKLILSTPAFMYKGSFNEIFDGIGNMINCMVKIMG